MVMKFINFNFSVIIVVTLLVSSVTTFAQAPEILWTKIIGGTQDQSASSVIETPNGGFIIAGSNSSDLYIINTNEDGDIIWTKSYSSNANLGASIIEQTSDNCFIITGIEQGHYCTDVFLAKINSLGDTLWFKWGLGYAYNPDVKQTFDGGYIVSAIINQAGEGLQYMGGLLVKTDSAGNISWDKEYGVEGATSVVQAEDGGFVFTGGYYQDAFLIKTNSFGDSIWCKIYEPPDSSVCGCNNNILIKTSDGGFLILIADHYYRCAYDM